MKKIYFICIIACLSLMACKKDDDSPNPVADFSWDDQKSSMITVPEANVFIFKNDSKNASSYLWDFGNGTTSTEQNPSLELNDAGTYTVTLTVKNAEKTATTKKQIKVVVPYITKIIIKNFEPFYLLPHVPSIRRADVWVEVKVKDKSAPYNQLSNGTYERSLFYKTPIHSNADLKAAPIVFDVPDKIMLPHYLVDKNYAFELYAKTASGTYLLYSTDLLGSIFSGDVESNQFNWYSNCIEIGGGYE